MLPRLTQPSPLVVLMMLTQTIGWGSSISLIGVLAAAIRSDLHISSTELYGGTTVMFLVGAVMAPMAGRITDLMGGLRVLCFGQPLLAAALLTLSVGGGLYSYFAAWTLFGLGMHFGLATAAYNGIAQVMGRTAYRAIGLVSLATGLCSTIFWPLSEVLLDILDWRQLCQIYAAVILFICTPIHIGLARRYDRCSGERRQLDESLSPAHVAPRIAGKAFRLLMVMQVLTASLGTAVAILAIDIFVALGVSRETAILAGSLLGIAYLISRGVDVLLGSRIGRMRLARVVHAALPLSLMPLLACATVGVPLPGWLALAAGGALRAACRAPRYPSSRVAVSHLRFAQLRSAARAARPTDRHRQRDCACGFRLDDGAFG